MTDLNSESFSALNFWKSVEKKNISTNFGTSSSSSSATATTSTTTTTPTGTKLIVPKKNSNSFPLLAPPAPPPPPVFDEPTTNNNNNNGNNANSNNALSNSSLISASNSGSFNKQHVEGSEWDEQNVTEAFGFWKQKAVQLQRETERYNARRNARQTIDLTNILRKSTSSDLLMKPPLESPPLTPLAQDQDIINNGNNQNATTTTTTTTSTTTTTTSTTTEQVLQANQLEIKFDGETIAVVDDSGTTPRDYRRSRSISCEIIPNINNIGTSSSTNTSTTNNTTTTTGVQQQQHHTIVEEDSSSSEEESSSSEEESYEDSDDESDTDLHVVPSDSRRSGDLTPVLESPTSLNSSTVAATATVDTTTDVSEVTSSTNNTTAVTSSIVEQDISATTAATISQVIKPDQASENSNATTTTTSSSTSTATTSTPSSSVVATKPDTTVATTSPPPTTTTNTTNQVAPPSPSSQRAASVTTTPVTTPSSTPSDIKKPINNLKDKKDPAKKSIGATLTRTVTKTFIRDSKENVKTPSSTSVSPTTGAASSTQGGTITADSGKKEKAKLSKQEKERIKQEKSAKKKKEKDEKKQQKSNKKALTKNNSSTDVKKGFITPQQQQIIDSPFRIYGVRLTQLVLSNDGDLPAILTQTITVLSNSRNLDVNAVFVGSENEQTVRDIRKKSDFERIDFSVIGDPRVVAGLLILFFAELPQPLFNSKFFGDLIEINDITNQQVKLNDLKYLINSLSQMRRSLLQILVTFFMSKYINGNPTLSRAAAVQSIATSFGPQFFRFDSGSNQDTNYAVVGVETLKLIIDNYAFLFEKTNEPDVHFKNVDGKMLISEGSIDKLIDKATDYYYPYNEKYFSLTFFITHLYFIQPSELVDRLIGLYRENQDTLETKKKWKKTRRSKKTSCINDAVKLWVDYCYKEMREDKELSKKILKGFPHLEAQLSSRLSHKTTINDFLKLPKRVHSRTRSASFSETFLSTSGSSGGGAGAGANNNVLSAMEIAEQCTLVDYDLFTNVRLSDWVRLMQGSVDPQTAPSLSLALKRSTIWAQWAMGEILSTEDKNQRVAIINLLVDVAINCKDLANFNTAISIHNALTNHHIKRLQQTWDAVPKETLNKMQQLEQSLQVWLKPDSTNPFGVICQSINSACVPHFSILRTVLSQIDQKIPTFIGASDDASSPGLVNVEKLRTIFGIVVEIQRLQQQRNYTMKPTKLFIQLQDINTVSMDELADLSLKCEPPVSKAKKYNAPDTMAVDEDWRMKITKTFNKPLATTSVGIDLPRLASSFTFNTSVTVTTPEEKSIVGNKIQDIFHVLVSLAQIESPQMESDVREKFASYIPMSTDPDSDFKRELIKFLEEICNGDQSKVVRILKCCNQAIIAPVIIEITLNIAKNVPFMDAGGWRILISNNNLNNNNNNNVILDKPESNDDNDSSLPKNDKNNNDEDSSNNNQNVEQPPKQPIEEPLFIRHYKKQRSRSAQSKDFFEFEWYIQLNLDKECKNIQSFDLKISNLVLSTDTIPIIRDQLLESFKPYLLNQECIQYINFNKPVATTIPVAASVVTTTEVSTTSSSTTTVVQESVTTTLE